VARPIEGDALKRSEGAVVWPLSPQPNRGTILHINLRMKITSARIWLLISGIREGRDRVTTSYAPPPKKGPHESISQEERQIAAELYATEINLGGGSEDGSAKPGFWVSLEGAQASEVNVRKAAKLTTLVSLRLSAGALLMHACLSSSDMPICVTGARFNFYLRYRACGPYRLGG